MGDDISDEKLHSYAYNKLRSLAVKLGVGGKGTKVALIKRISDHRDSVGGFGGHDGPDANAGEEIQPDDAPAVKSSNVVACEQETNVVGGQVATPQVAKASASASHPRESWFRTLDDIELDSAATSATTTPDKEPAAPDALAPKRVDIELIALTTFCGQMSSKFQQVYRCGAPDKMSREKFDRLVFPEFKPREQASAAIIAAVSAKYVGKGIEASGFTTQFTVKSAAKRKAPQSLVSPMRRAPAGGATTTSTSVAKKVALVVKTPTQTAAKSARRGVKSVAKSTAGRMVNPESNGDVGSMEGALINLNTSVESDASFTLCSRDQGDVSLMTADSDTSVFPSAKPAAVKPSLASIAPRSRVLAMAGAINSRLTCSSGKPRTGSRAAVSAAATRGARATPAKPVEATPEPVPASAVKPKPMSKAVPEPVPASAVKPKPTSKAVPEPVSASAVKPKPTSKAVPELVPASAVKPKPTSKAVPELVPASAVKPKPTPKAVPEPVSASAVKPKPTSKAVPEPVSASAVKPKPTSKAVPEPVAKVAASVTAPTSVVKPPAVAATPASRAVKPRRAPVLSVGASSIKATPQPKPARTVPVPCSSAKPVRPAASTIVASSAVKDSSVPSALATPAQVAASEPEFEIPAENPLAWAMLSSPVRTDLREQTGSSEQEGETSEYNITPVKAKAAPAAAAAIESTVTATATVYSYATPKSTPLNAAKREHLVVSSAYKTPVVKAAGPGTVPVKSAIRTVSKTPLSSRGNVTTGGQKTPLSSSGAGGSRSVVKPPSSTLYHSARKTALGSTTGSAGCSTARTQVLSQSLAVSSRAAMMGVSGAVGTGCRSTFKPNLHSSIHSTGIKKTAGARGAIAAARLATTAVKKPSGFKSLNGSTALHASNKENVFNSSSGTGAGPHQASSSSTKDDSSAAPSVDDNVGVNPFLSLIAE